MAEIGTEDYLFIFIGFTDLEKLHDLYFSTRIIRMIKDDKMGLVCGTHGKKRNEYGILVGKLEGERLLGRRKRRSEFNIKMNVWEEGWDGVDWIDLA
jgi:hypothetical protein